VVRTEGGERKNRLVIDGVPNQTQRIKRLAHVGQNSWQASCEKRLQDGFIRPDLHDQGFNWESKEGVKNRWENRLRAV